MELFTDDQDRVTIFAELLLPVPIPKFFTYRVPYSFNENIKKGQRVIVPFGDRKILTGIVINLHESAPTDYEAKLILDMLDDFPIVSEQQLNLFSWISEYYMCTQGEIMTAAIPAGLKLSSESKVQVTPGFSLDDSDLLFSDKELTLLNRLREDSLTYTEISKLLGVKNIHGILKSLTRKGCILLFEEVKDKYKPKTEKKVRLHENYTTPQALEKVFEAIGAKPKQEGLLLSYLQHVPVLHDASSNKNGLSKKILLGEGASASSLQTLVKQNILEEFDAIVPRFEISEMKDAAPVMLSENQSHALTEIIQGYDTQDIALLHGVTGSGKTEVYINLIRKALENDGQVLLMLPEIALTTQIVQRLKKVFGTSMGVYHSRFSDNERVEVWNGIINGTLKFIVGVRSSVFLPFDNLALIIVDEEHDSSYKQQEPAPRYHARDTALMLARFHHAKVLLGSATPSIETYYHASTGRYALIKLTQRFGDAKLPEVVLADMVRERQQKSVKGEFSSLLLKNIGETLKQKDQVILFQNRRGYSPMINCEDCGWIPKCSNCSVSLTYHQYRNSLVCHYCGYRETLPAQCPTCSSARIRTVGYGTEKLEEELKIHFDQAHIQRMDLDTTRTKSGYETILEQFEKGETNILVGTQMVTKGLDFDHVSLVGVFNADRMMHFPDFRAYERAYQLITQVSGRAGRREKPGKVVIQTSDTENPILQFILNNNFNAFFEHQIADRKMHHYPPFTRLIEISVKHLDRKVAQTTADYVAHALRKALPEVFIIGPGEPVIAKIRNQFILNILLKVPRNAADRIRLKQAIQAVVEQTMREKSFRNSKIVIDVDPA